MNRTKPNSRQNDRQGWSLIEMSLMIALLGGFTLVATSLLTNLMQLDTSIATGSAFELTVERLEDQLREDARTTVRTKIVDSGVNLITQQGQTIQYRVNEGKVERRIVGERHVSQQIFAFMESSVSLVASGETIELTIRKTGSLSDKSRASLLGTREGTSIRVLFPLGRALRFASSSNSKGEDS